MASTSSLESRPVVEAPAASAPAPSPAAVPVQTTLPAERAGPAFSRVLADIAACAPGDALADAQEALDELNARLADLRGLKPATAALLFGSDAAWRSALARVGVEVGRRMSGIGALRRAAGLEPDFSLDEIARPIAAGTSVRWTGD